MNTIGASIPVQAGQSPVRPEPLPRSDRPDATEIDRQAAPISAQRDAPYSTQTNQTYPPAVRFDRESTQILQELQATEATVQQTQPSAASNPVTTLGPDGRSYAVSPQPSQRAGTSVESSQTGQTSTPQNQTQSQGADIRNNLPQNAPDQTLSPETAATVAQSQFSGQQYSQVNNAYLANQAVERQPTQVFTA